MKIPRYWATWEADLRIDGQVQRSRFTGGSDISGSHALEVAQEQARAVQSRIDRNDGQRAEGYEVAIREEIVRELSPEAIVTRNRYGAEVLNCAGLVMIDVDHAPGPGLWASLFGGDKRSPKQRMLDRIREVANKHRDRSIELPHLRDAQGLPRVGHRKTTCSNRPFGAALVQGHELRCPLCDAMCPAGLLPGSAHSEAFPHQAEGHPLALPL